MLRQAAELFEDPIEQENFCQALISGTSQISTQVWLRRPICGRDPASGFRALSTIDYVGHAPTNEEKGGDPQHHTGEYYQCDLSSILESIPALSTLGTSSQELCVLDMCASPGGKTVITWRVVHPRILICNEVVQNRIAALISNLKRCQISPVAVCSLDPSTIAQRFGSAFDVVLVDAPCSGQSLLARGRRSDGCFHPLVLKRNALRQRRILTSAVQSLTNGGSLLYSTCTFSLAENERTVEWLLEKNPSLEAVNIASLLDFRSVKSPVPCYRFYPHRGAGAGGFCALFQLRDNTRARRPLRETEFAWAWKCFMRGEHSDERSK